MIDLNDENAGGRREESLGSKQQKQQQHQETRDNSTLCFIDVLSFFVTVISGEKKSSMATTTMAAPLAANDDDEAVVVMVQATTLPRIVTPTLVEIVKDDEPPEEPCNDTTATTACTTAACSTSLQEEGCMASSAAQALDTPQLPPSLAIERVDIDDYMQAHDDDVEAWRRRESSSDDCLDSTNNNNKKQGQRRRRRKRTQKQLWMCFASAMLIPLVYFSIVAAIVRHQVPPSKTPWIHPLVNVDCDESYANALWHLELLLRHAYIEFACTCGVLLFNLGRACGVFTHARTRTGCWWCWNFETAEGEEEEDHQDDDDQEAQEEDEEDDYPSLMMVLVLEVPMFMMAILLAVCGYINNFSTAEVDPFTYPTETLKRDCADDEMDVFVIEHYRLYYICVWIRIVLSFGLWTSHGNQLFKIVSAHQQQQDQQDDDEVSKQFEQDYKDCSKCRRTLSAIVSVVVFLLATVTLFTIMHPAVQELRAMDPR